MVICVSSAFCSTDQEKRETARRLYWIAFRVGKKKYPVYSLRASSSFGGYRETWTRERRARGDAKAGAAGRGRAFS